MDNHPDATSEKPNQSNVSSYAVSIIPASVVKILSSVAAALVLISITLQLLLQFGSTDIEWLVNFFDVNRESNIPTFYSVFLLILSSILLLLITMLEKRRKTFHSWMWGILAAGFLVLALDELASFHEKLTYYVRIALDVKQMGVLYLYGWVVPGILIVLAAGFFFLRFWLRLPEKTRLFIAIAAVLYVGGAIGMEMAAGSYLAQTGKTDITYNILATIEEALEMGGIILFIHTLMAYIMGIYGEVRIQLGGAEKEAPEPR
jgi:hypothetical protein